MPLTLYRRHLKSCAVHKAGLPPRAKRYWTECECPVWMCGKTDTMLVPRQSTGFTDWAAAVALRDSMNAKSKDERIHGPRLQECIDTYVASRRHELAERTIGQHELVLGRLAEYAAGRGVYFARELTVDLIESFKMDGLTVGDASKKVFTSKVRAFLKDALRRGWILEPLAQKVRPHTAPQETKEPFTDAEVKKILDGAGTLSHGKGRYSSHPATFRLLLELMLATGMRVGDAVRYDPALAVKGQSLWLYSYAPQKGVRSKRAKIVDAYISDALKTAIDACAWMSLGRLPFAFGSGRDASYLSHEVYERMQT
ncbi:MAG TPA: hypothetical protein VMB03_34585, partial [Bryobacteraceae bacterium]|nr:hypothetical protein [Bryobacteraceae bacterium]